MAAAAQLQPEALAVDPWVRVEALPCMLSVEIAVPRFTVGDLVRLAAGRLVDTRWTVGADVPLLINGQLVAWSEFEIVNNHVAVRLTELA
ncbi:MAG TPA: FliM/FliN family flagellar motor C-terminal domain-containing protein [Terriglobales bacterium]|nr:FliM/FliN family flagellar motor C-terminal domain-containing protein [Terriglobales bacterium]